MTLDQTLRSMVDSGKVPHAIMLHEDDGGGGVSVALDFLSYLYKDPNKVGKLIHPDVHFVFPVTSGNLSVSFSAQWRELVTSKPDFTENDLNEALGVEGKLTMIAVPEAKALLDCLNVSALEGGYRSAVIYLPEKMNQEASNRLLKVIEEPAPYTQFVLITHAPEKVLRTISSRCQQIRVAPSARKSAGITFEEFNALMNALAARNLPAALEIGDALANLPSRESAKSFCKYASDRLRSVFMIQQGMEGIADADEATRYLASVLPGTFPRGAAAAIDRARMLIDRNVNLKILFTDMVDRMYLRL